MSELHFLRPQWLLLLVPALAIIWLWSRYRTNISHWAAQIEPELLAVLLEPNPAQNNHRTGWLTMALITLTCVGLAGPTWERVPQPVVQNNDALVIVLDLSLSMYVQDLAPSRLVRARQKITDVLRLRDQGFTALIAYAGDAHTVAPLTDDTRTIENLLSSLSPDMMPVLGSNVDSAMSLAKSLMENAGMLQGRILLVTDGVDRVNDVTSHAQSDYPVSILGIGTPDGGPIPLDFANQPGRHLQTNQGDVINAKLDTDRLAKIADHCYGTFRQVGVGDDDILVLLDTPLPGEDTTTASDRQFDSWLDRGYWLVLLALPLLLLCFRRGLVVSLTPALLTLLLLTTLGLPQPAQAGFWEDLWQRDDQQGYQRLIEGEPEYAVPLLGESDWAPVAKYRSGAYADAAQDFTRDSQARAGDTSDTEAAIDAAALTATYNLGNAQAHLGDYQRAINTYESVLAVAPDHADAEFNKELLERLLAEQQQASSEDNSEEQDQGGERGDEQRESQQDQSQTDPDQEQAEDEDGQQQENQEEQQEQQAQAEQSEDPSEQLAEAEQSRDENADALEQWLRRVPDDPGGLLKRKFKYEHKQRLRSGDYRNREAEKIW